MMTLDSKRYRRAFLTLGCLMGLIAGNTRAEDESSNAFIAPFERDWRAICSFGSRFPGQEGEVRTAAYLEEQLAEAGVEQLWRQPVELVVPVTHACTLRIEIGSVGEIATENAEEHEGASRQGTKVSLYPVWPNGANLSTTPRGGLSGRAIYVGEGRLDELPVDALPGNVAVMEFNSASRWQYAAMYGAAAIIFLPPDNTTWAEANAKYTYISLPLPRFYVEDRAVAERLRRGDRPGVAIDARVNWERHTAHNILGYIPGSDPAQRDKVVVLSARYDASGAVPDLAFGAEQAINAAAVLQLAREYAERPPAYSVLVSFTAGDTFMLRGSRRLMTTLTDTQMLLEEGVTDAVSELEQLEGYREKLTSDDLITAISGWDNRLLRSEHLIWQVKMRIGQLLREMADLRDRVREQDVSEQERQALQDRIDRLDERRIHLLALQRHLGHDELTPRDVEILAQPFNDAPSLLQRTLTRLDRMISDRRDRHQRQTLDLEMMRTLGLGEGDTGDYARGILYISLELSSHGTRFGPFAQSYFCVRNLQNQLLRYGGSLKAYATAIDLPGEVQYTYLDDTAEGRRHWQSDLPFPIVNGIDAATNSGCLGVMFATTQDMRRWVDTPLDTADRVDLDNVRPQLRMLRALLDRALREPMAITGSRIARTPIKWKGMAVLASPGEAQSNLGLSDCLLVARGYEYNKQFGQRGIGVRDMFALKTDGEGRYEVNDIIAFENRPYPIMAEVYRLDDDGLITMAMNQSGLGIKPVNGHPRMERPDYERAIGEMFDCRQVGLYGLFDPRYLENLDRVKIIEAARSSEVEPRCFVQDAGMMSVFVPERVDRWQLVFARGDAQRRMVMLNNDAEHPNGLGFDRQWRQTRPLVFTSAHDFAVLNEDRLTRLEHTGVVDPYLRELHEAGKEEVAEAVSARESGRARLAWKHAAAGLANQSQVYHKTRSAADDTIHAVLFLLVGLVPFCYFVERLVMAATNVYRQIAGFAGLFVAMTVLIALFHPAFRISITPLTILLAFLILFLSTLVIVIVVGKFQAELRRISGETDEGQAGDFKRSSMLNRAMLLGVANMRRRKMRTGLTLATLMLLSFVIMSFTNPGTALHPIHYQVTTFENTAGSQANRQAIMIHRLSWQPLPAWVLDHLRTAQADRADVYGHWWITRNDLRTLEAKSFRIESDAGASSLISAAMCVSPEEMEAVSLDGLLGADGMERFASRDDAILISRALAERLNVAVDSAALLFGRRFEVTGILGDQAMLGLTGLNGQTFAPIDFMSYTRDRADREKIHKLIELAEAAETGGDITQLVQADEYRPLPPEQFVILRDDRAAEFDATLRGVILKPHDPTQTMAIADELAGQVHRPVYARTANGITLCAAAEVTRLAGLGNILVPLIISALIIFNTMLNSVYERQNEISIFMSLGLAPAHVGALFLAEAAACGTIGVVGGYILGQALGTLASTWDLIPGLQLNYSSSSAVMTQLAIMSVVLLSAIWPARLARRLAAPGSESTWELPEPDGDVLEATLPFTMLARDAEPVLAYLRRWLESHTEASLGRFCSGQAVPFVREGSGPDERSQASYPERGEGSQPLDTQRARGLATTIWLAPFDMGLMQSMTLTIRPSRDPLIHEIIIRLTRQAGAHSVWLRSNRHFLTELRKQLLLWRSLKPENAKRYRDEAPALFAGTGASTIPT